MKTDQWNQGQDIPEAVRARVSQQQHASRRRFCEAATQLPDGIVLQADTLKQIGEIQAQLQSD